MMRKPSQKYLQNVVKFSYGMSGKMTGVLSLSTNCTRCNRCIKRHNMPKGVSCICSWCYAFDLLAENNWKSKNMIKAYDFNTDVLTVRELNPMEITLIAIEAIEALKKNGTTFLRYESFGDIQNVIHALNYWKIAVEIARRADWVNIGWWTKNFDIMLKAWRLLSEEEKTEARKVVSVVISSLFMNMPVSDKVIAKIESELGMAVTVFTVYNNDDVIITCGGNHCLSCNDPCYIRPQTTRAKNELLKELQ